MSIIYFILKNPLISILAFIGFSFIYNNIRKFIVNFQEHYIFLKERRKDYWNEHRKLSDVIHDVHMLQNWRKERESDVKCEEQYKPMKGKIK